MDEATSLGASLVLTGTIDRFFDTSDFSLVTSYENSDNDEFVLTDETFDEEFTRDDDGNNEINLTYSEPSTLYSTAAWGLSSSNSSVNMTSIIIEVWPSGGGDPVKDDDIMLGNFSSSPFRCYYYLYLDGETILDGTFHDTDHDEYHEFKNIRFFEGWNRIVKSTADGQTFTYTGGEINDVHWTYIDNPEDVDPRIIIINCRL